MNQEPDLSIYSNFRILIYFENVICKFDEAVVSYYNQQFDPPKKKDPFDDSWKRNVNIENNFAKKEKDDVLSIPLIPEFWETVEPYEDVLKTFNAMRNCGMDLRIVMSLKYCGAMPYILEWIERHFNSPSWAHRVIVTNDKTALFGDYLIDSDRNPEKTGDLTSSETKISWRHVVFDHPYNRFLKDKLRMINWDTWKSAMGMDYWTILSTGEPRPYFNHGSPDSKDRDRDYLFTEMPDPAVAFMFDVGVEEDRNIIVVKDNYLTDALKGNHDECNNALLTTYMYHEQDFPCPIKKKMMRIIPTKVFSTVRKVIASAAEQKDLRKIILRALKSPSTKDRINIFRSLDMTVVGGSMTIEVLKSIAFQYAQTLSLINGAEIYTKGDAADSYPELRPFLYRESNIYECLPILNQKRDQLLKEIDDIEILPHDDLNIVYWNFDSDVPLNAFKSQCRNMVLSGTDKLISIGLLFPTSNLTDWGDNSQDFEISLETEVVILTRRNERTKGGVMLSNLIVLSLQQNNPPCLNETEILEYVHSEDLGSKLPIDEYFIIFEIERNPSLNLIYLGARSKLNYTTTREKLELITL